jgi:hypothetical protein
MSFSWTGYAVLNVKVISELDSMHKEAATAYFKVLSQHLARGIEKKHRTSAGITSL